MRKAILSLGFLVFILILSSCGPQEDHLNNIKTALEGIGYVFEQRDEDAITYYNNKAVNEAYDIDVTLTDLYIGYVNDTEGWLELLVFESDADCDAFIEGTTESGYIIYREGNVAFITYSSDAMAPFIETGTKSD